MASKGYPNPIDVWIGSRIRQRRVLLGLTQTQIGDSAGISFQQIQKYERGTNRVSSSRLTDIAAALKWPIEEFFRDMPQDIQDLSPAQIGDKPTPTPKLDIENTRLIQRETLQLTRAYWAIKDPEVRKQLRVLIRTIIDTN